MYQEGVSVAIAGATNSGKSSLFNLLLRQDRAIVSETHGTTRDWLEGTAMIQGIPVRLFDTAGLRPTADPLEREGMRRTREVIDAADVVVYLVDGTRGADAADRALLDGWAGAAPLIRAWNKSDLPAVASGSGRLSRRERRNGAGHRLTASGPSPRPRWAARRWTAVSPWWIRRGSATCFSRALDGLGRLRAAHARRGRRRTCLPWTSPTRWTHWGRSRAR